VIDQLVKAPPIWEARDRELLKDAYSFVYYNSPHGDLAAHFFVPHEHDPETASAPMIAFFHGGLWDASLPTQFVPHCLHFAARGALAATVQYRVKNNEDTSPIEALEDAVMMMGFLKTNAHLLGINPEQIVLGGAGSGGYLALACATLPEIGGLPASDFRPAAAIGFSPIVDTTRRGVGSERFANDKEAKAHSPAACISKDLPPLAIFHAHLDRVVPFKQVSKFVKRYRRKKNRIEFVDFVGAGHTFFNYNSHQQNFEITIRSSDHFLTELGILPPDPLAGEFD
jgi:acetyl esterase/lipase